MSDEREALDANIRVRVSERVHNRLLLIVGQNSTVSEYVRRLLEAAVNEPSNPSEEFVPQTVDEFCDSL